jgi:centractin
MGTPFKYYSFPCATVGADQTLVQLGPERFRAAEILFNPEIIGLEDAGVHQVVVDSINRVDMDLRKSLYSNIVLSGGTTLCTGALNLGRA